MGNPRPASFLLCCSLKTMLNKQAEQDISLKSSVTPQCVIVSVVRSNKCSSLFEFKMYFIIIYCYREMGEKLQKSTTEVKRSQKKYRKGKKQCRGASSAHPKRCCSLVREGLQMFLPGSQRDDSETRSSSSGPEFNSQKLHGSSQSSIMRSGGLFQKAGRHTDRTLCK